MFELDETVPDEDGSDVAGAGPPADDSAPDDRRTNE